MTASITTVNGHNPCFNRITFAIQNEKLFPDGEYVTILVLIE